MDKHSYNEHINNNMRYCRGRTTEDSVELNGGAIIPRNENSENIAPPTTDDKHFCEHCDCKCKNEHGGEVFVTNVTRAAFKNENFRESYWTGKYLQMTLMSLDYDEDIGVECHADTDQYIRIERGYALITTGYSHDCMWNKKRLCEGESVFIPAGTWHNIENCGRGKLKLSSIYAPPHHPRCTIEKYK